MGRGEERDRQAGSCSAPVFCDSLAAPKICTWHHCLSQARKGDWRTKVEQGRLCACCWLLVPVEKRQNGSSIADSFLKTFCCPPFSACCKAWTSPTPCPGDQFSPSLIYKSLPLDVPHLVPMYLPVWKLKAEVISLRILCWLRCHLGWVLSKLFKLCELVLAHNQGHCSRQFIK